MYTISIRSKPKDIPIKQFINKFYSNIALSDIESVYGFTRFCRFYGGRSFEQQISRRDVFWLYDNGISLRLPVSNHNFSIEVFREERAFFKDFHRSGNSVICTNDNLAKQIRADFPLYSVEASAIKDINTVEAVNDNLVLYDKVVIPMSYNNDIGFLDSLEQKSRIILFGNALCAYNCPNKLCYKHIADSIFNKANQSGVSCSKSIIERENLGYIEFDVEKFLAMGFICIKLIRPVIKLDK